MVPDSGVAAAQPDVKVQNTTSPVSSASAGAPVFEDAMRELETIIHGMEAGTLSLEQSLEAYKRGAELVKQCQAALERVRDQVRVLDGDVLKPFEVRPGDEATDGRALT